MYGKYILCRTDLVAQTKKKGRGEEVGDGNS
jgi:hypothetical protein